MAACAQPQPLLLPRPAPTVAWRRAAICARPAATTSGAGAVTVVAVAAVLPPGAAGSQLASNRAHLRRGSQQVYSACSSVSSARWACWQISSITAAVTGPLRLVLRMAAKSARTWGFTPSTLISDDGVFNRDVIDLAMMKPSLALLRQALLKAHGAYGDAIRQDLDKALLRLRTRQGWLERCMQTLAMAEPKAVVWQRLRALRRN